MFILGGLVIQDFGEGVDEWHNAFYGELFLGLYTGETLFQNPGVDYYNGPFYFMLFTFTSRLFAAVVPQWLVVDGRHLTNWITFLTGGFFLFDLTLRATSRRTAWFALGLYLTQPLLIGHAFINQKDVPLMAFFLMSLALGWRALEAWQARLGKAADWAHGSAEPFIVRLRREWRSIESWGGRTALFVSLAIIALLLVDSWAEIAILPSLRNILVQAYEQRAFSPLQALFNHVATDAYKTPLELYLAKLETAYFWLRLVTTLVGMGSLLGLTRWRFPETYAAVLKPRLQLWIPLLFGAIALGLSTSIRLAALFAGVLVSLLFLYQLRWRAIGPLTLYWVVALAVTYSSWPAIWGDPLRLFLERVLRTNEFIDHDVLFLGSRYPANHLPMGYAPTLIALQLTIPSLLLAAFGFAFCSPVARNRGLRSPAFLGILLWLSVPLALAMTGTIPIYNNFRHLLFTVPALVVVAAAGAAWIWEALPSRLGRGLLLIAAFLPGMFSIVTLHPYQYVYFNELAGGVRGASGRFDLDYWCVSMREAVNYVNEIAPPEARVAVWGGLTTAVPFAREDIDLYADWGSRTTPDFAIGCQRAVSSPRFFPQLEPIARVEVRGAPLAVIKADGD